MRLNTIEHKRPVMSEAMLPATAFRGSPVVATLISLLLCLVTTNQAVRPKQRLIQGEATVAISDILSQSKTKPMGIAAPPTMTPSTVKIHVRLIDTAFRMQQNLYTS